jgi:hypothetical protein
MEMSKFSTEIDRAHRDQHFLDPGPIRSTRRLTWISPIGHSPMAKVHFTFANTPTTFANWRESTVLSPTYSHDFPQLARARRTFANTLSWLTLVGESPPYFRQYICGLWPLAKVLLVKFGNPYPTGLAWDILPVNVTK